MRRLHDGQRAVEQVMERAAAGTSADNVAVRVLDDDLDRSYLDCAQRSSSTAATSEGR